MDLTQYPEVHAESVNAESVNTGGIGGNKNTSDSQAAPSSKGIFQFFFGKTSKSESKNWVSSFFSSSSAQNVNDSKSWLNWGKTIKQVAPPLSKQAIEKQGSLFSPRDFQKIASSRIVNFFGRPFDPPRKDVLRSLQAYQQKAPSLSAEAKWSALDALEIKTQSYFSDKQTMLGRLPQGSSQRVNLGKDIQAAELLLKGIALEKQKLAPELNEIALKKQKDLTEKYPCTILEEDTAQDGTASTASGEMATLNIVTYRVQGVESNEKNTGY